ncbi:hypothetical protein CDO52_19695 [Nocardiopsis gilva YIM 90087]|uniref:Uncharacterized protein n=1 Tax=Nocardiopsis gilva YIM 90087 TaxID=1235441 RepID=A0A223S9D3_9ACTN|nr:hypothetical protein [Nocardiopsis gilva]ASU84727.1 hypothetical protein CDO52_19695 [Nocardiopsis gilva YIM 90087]
MVNARKGKGNGNGHRKMTAKEVENLQELIVEGGALGHEHRESQHEAGGERPTLQQEQVLELHVCMGLNACRHHDMKHEAPMAGTCQCSTVQHVCHGDNQCRGQGGCGYLGAEYEQSIPGEQSCCENGSCATPINESRVASAGPFKGTGVWKLARKRFEQRMWDAGRPFGPSPGEGSRDEWVPEYEDRRPLLKEIEDARKKREKAAAANQSMEMSDMPFFEGGA